MGRRWVQWSRSPSIVNNVLPSKNGNILSSEFKDGVPSGLGSLVDKNRKPINRGKWKDGEFESTVKGSDEIRLKEVETKAEAYNSQTFSNNYTSAQLLGDKKTKEIKLIHKSEVIKEVKIDRKSDNNTKEDKTTEKPKDKEKTKKKVEDEPAPTKETKKTDKKEEKKEDKKEDKKTDKKTEETTREASKKKIKKIDM